MKRTPSYGHDDDDELESRRINFSGLPSSSLPNAMTPPKGSGASGKVHVLVVDDEKMIRSLLKMSLLRMGYEVTTAEDGEEALTIFHEHRFDLVLLDILMPGVDGFTVCSELRRISDVPVIMLTALNRPDDIVRGLELGADNYITKPFTFKEVEARIRAILRRTSTKMESEPIHVLEYGDVRLDSGMRAAIVSGNLVELTRTEYQLLHYLMTHVDRPVSKETLLEQVWNYEAADTNSNIVELAIRRLRKKLEEDASHPQRLLTVRGVGYKFTPKGVSARRAPQAGNAPAALQNHPPAAAATPAPHYRRMSTVRSSKMNMPLDDELISDDMDLDAMALDEETSL